MAPHSSSLAWKISWMEEPVHGVVKSRTQLRDFTFTFHFHALEKEMATHSSVLACRIPGMGEPGGLLSMGSHRVRLDWSKLAAAAAVSRKRYGQTMSGLTGNIWDVGSIPGLRRPPGEGHGNPLQYSCLENPMDRRAWRAIIYQSHKESDMTEVT